MPTSSWEAWPSLTLPLAADARLVDLDFTNDQIWAITIGDAENRALLLQTNYGLRARSMRIFPRFRFPGQAQLQDAATSGAMHIEAYYPNYLRLRLSPHEDIETTMEWWAPSGQEIAGRVSLHNRKSKPARMEMHISAELNPFKGGARIESSKVGGAEILHGRSSDLHPVLFLTGGATSLDSPYPALALDVELAPQQTRRFTWVQAAMQTTEASFQAARRTAARDWQAEVDRIEMRNRAQLEIQTGDPEWDRVLQLSQQVALSLLHSPSDHLPYTSFVEARRYEHGYFPPDVGADYNQLWLGQGVLQSWYYLEFALPGEMHIAEGILLNFLASQGKDGRIDSKPGISGQRSRTMASPLLADIAWRIYEVGENNEFIEKVFPTLVAFHNAWFDESQDSDGDGLPEWANAVQAGFDDHPIFSPWHDWSQGADITRFRSPVLYALLHQQASRLLQISTVLEKDDHHKELSAQQERLRKAIDETWDGRAAAYRNIDSESKLIQRGKRIILSKGDGKIAVGRDFTQPTRFIIKLDRKDDNPGSIRISLSGKNVQGRRSVEKFSAADFRWGDEIGTTTSSQLFTYIDHLRVEGLSTNNSITLRSIDTSVQDLTLFAPLYAGLPDKETAQKMIERNIHDPKRFWRPYGLPAFIRPQKKADQTSMAVWCPWVSIVARGLLAYDQRPLAAELMTRIMKAATHILKEKGEFRQFHHAENAQSFGEINHIAGLPPIGLFLKTLGVKVYSPWKVGLVDTNPYAWPVLVKYRGLRIERDMHETRITFPDGRTITVDEPAACIVDGRADGSETK